MESSSPSDTNEIHEQSCSIQDLSGVPLPDSSGEINNRMEPEPADSFELSGEYADNECAIFVSASEYNEKKAQIDQLVQKILTMEQQQRQLEENASDTKELCDLKLRLQKLNARLEALGEFLDTLRVREDQQEINIEDDSELVDQTEQPKWSNLYSGLNRYRQKANHTAAQFYQHKSNIIDSLKFLLQREKGNSDLNYYALEKTPQFITEQISDERYNEIYERFLKSLGYNPGEKILGIYILVLLLRLRQFCCHPGLMIGMLRGTLAAEDVQNVKVDALDVEGQLKIDVLAQLDKFYESASGDDSCDEEDSTRRHGNFKLEVIKDEIKEVYVPWDSSDDLPSTGSFEDQLDTARALKLLNPQNPIFQFIRPSAKLKLIIDKLEEILTGTNDKIIVTSQWVSYLAIIRKRLQDLSWETLDFNGQLTAKEREIVVRDFNANNDKRVLLLSLTAGGVGLNLNVANHMLIVDLHWNPQLERQAQDRIYRYGQTKPTFIYRYMCQDTVEQRIKSLQDCKLEMAKVVLPEEGGEVSRCVGGGLDLAELTKLLEM
ncbi:GM10445 [Drosophila sechellia]|uniref:GM10445 n=1 Tax=Drosophila sechellia TaxID=7238 RepID=B4I4Z1_DROSE|nr:GM10445 [Drosophila sechellia]